MLGHVAYMIALWVHDHVSVGLLEAEEDVHHLNLALDHDARLLEEGGGRVVRLENRSGVFWDVYWRK